ncbi:MAG: outer membrane lipoprotein-sorting protein [Gammaproteobacteria bacterium]|nr:outer membrane lipoprotein-sorting protein [Gammaproteobacteria bacterium]
MFNIGIVPGSDQARNRTAEIGLHYFGYLFLFCAVPAMAALPDEGDLTAEAFGLAVFEEADRRASGYVDLQVNLEMILRNSRGRESRRLLRIKQLEKPDDGDKLLVVFDTPKSLKGSALLSFSHKVEPDDQWLFLPAVKRVKRIASRNKSGPFLSSEFAFEDLTLQEVEKFTYRYLRREMLDDVECFVVQRKAVDVYSGYSKQIVWLDTEAFRIQQIEYFNRRGDLMKTLKVQGYTQHKGRYWKADRMLMVNHWTGKSTELLWRDYRFATGLSDERDFSPNSLRRVR